MFIHDSLIFNEIRLKVAKNIIENEEDKNPKDKQGETPFHIAARRNDFEMIKLIIERVKDKNPKEMEYGNTPLHLAAKGGNLELFQLIFDQTQEKNPRNYVGYTPLHYAANEGDLCKIEVKFGGICNHINICKLIIDNIGFISPKTFCEETPLQMAVKSGHTAVAEFLSEKKDQNEKSKLILHPR